MTIYECGKVWPVSRALLAAFCLVGAAVPGIAIAGGNFGFLNDAPIASFTKPDLEMFRSNVYEALDRNADGDIHHWENSDTGSSGDIELIKSFTQDSKHCRQIRIRNRARGYAEAKTDFVFCKETDGKWRVVTPSKPPAAGSSGKPANN